MTNHQVFNDSIDREKTFDEDNPAVEEDGIAFFINKTSKEAKSIKSYWNEDHVVRIFFIINNILKQIFFKYVFCSQKKTFTAF